MRTQHKFVPDSRSNSLNCETCGESREYHWKQDLQSVPPEYECVFISNWPRDANCYQCGRSREEHDKGIATVNIERPVLLLDDDVERHSSGDGGEATEHLKTAVESFGGGDGVRYRLGAPKRATQPILDVPADAEASLSEWYDEVERNRREDEKQRIEKEWYENERSRAATADYEYQVEEEE